ncbi:hypothetical protein ACNJX9_12480 [Bradyrhizobium sp. DASA03076]
MADLVPQRVSATRIAEATLEWKNERTKEFGEQILNEAGRRPAAQAP